MAHVIVIGAGVVGCASAWALTRAGHQVTIVNKIPRYAVAPARATGRNSAMPMAMRWPRPAFCGTCPPS